GCSQRDQPAAIAHLDEAGRTPRRAQETLEILWLRVVHAAARMTRAQITPVQRKALVAVAPCRNRNVQVRIACEAAALAAIRTEACDRHPAGDTCGAPPAAREIHVPARAPVTASHREFVDAIDLRCSGIDDQVLRFAIGEIAARMRQGLEKAHRAWMHRVVHGAIRFSTMRPITTAISASRIILMRAEIARPLRSSPARRDAASSSAKRVAGSSPALRSSSRARVWSSERTTHTCGQESCAVGWV